MSVSVETEADADQQRDHEDPAAASVTNIDTEDDEIAAAEELLRKEDLESRLGGSPQSCDSQESLTREEKLLEEMLRLKLVGSGGGATNAMLPPKQRIKLYQPRSKLEQFEDILIESQLLDQSLPDLGGTPLDYEKFDLENLSLQEALNGITDFDTSDAIFAEKNNDNLDDDIPDLDGSDRDRESSSMSGSCECESCVERSVLVAEMAEETKKLQQCWLQLRDDFKLVYRLVMDEAWNDSNRPKPSLDAMQEAVHKLVWKDPHQLFQRLEAHLKDIVVELKLKLVELLSKQAKNPSLAQDFIQTLLAGHEKLCEASKLLSPVLSDLEVNHLRRFTLTWELLSKHLYQVLVYSDPLIQNNLPIFISQLRALYPNKENEEKYTELVRGYLDFDVEMENVGVFWSGTEALLLEYSQEQLKLREKQKMLKSDWEKFKAQRKQIENSLKEKADSQTGGDAFAELGESLQHLLTGLEDLGVESLPLEMENEMRRAMSLSPHPSVNLDTDSLPSSAFASQFGTPYGLSPAEEIAFSSMIHQMMVGGAVSDDCDPVLEHFIWESEAQWEGEGEEGVAVIEELDDDDDDDDEEEEETEEEEKKCNVKEDAQDCECHVCIEPPTSSASSLFPPEQPPVTSSNLYPHLYNIPGYSATSTTTTVSSVVSSVASLSAALSSALSLTTGTVSTAVTSTTESPVASKEPTPAREVPDLVSSTSATQTESLTEQPQRPTSLPVTSQSQTTETEKDKDNKKAPLKPLALDKRPTTCNHKHNNPNAKELKKMMGHDCSKNKSGPRKSKSSSAIPSNGAKGDEEGESSDSLSEDSEPEDTCSGSSGGGDKQCACCYCEVFGHGNPSGAPVPSNYPQMRERLRLLLSKKKRSNRAAASACQQQSNKPAAAAQPQQQPRPAVPPQSVKPPPQQTVPNRTAGLQQVVRQPNSDAASLSKKDMCVDEILDYIEGNKSSASDKKRLKKERQKNQKLEMIKAKQEEERRRKAAEEAARKAIEEQERLRKEAEDKALKKSKKKAAQKAKKLAAGGGQTAGTGPTSGSSTPVTPAGTNPSKPEAMMELENMQLEHIRQQKELLEKQKRQLEEQQRRLDEELNRKIAEKNAAQAAAVAAEKAKDAANSQLSKKQAKKAAKKASAAAGLSQSASSTSINSSASLPSSYSSPSYPQPQTPYAPYQAQAHVPPYNNPYPPHSSAFNMPGMFPGMGGPMGGPPQYQQPSSGFPSAFSPFQASFQSSPMQPQAQPPKPSVPPPSSVKSDQPMVTIKRVMRPDTNEPTVTISVKKDEGKKKEKEQVLFTLVNGQVMKTSSAPDNLIPSAVPMPKDLQKRILPEDLQDGSKLSKKQKKKLKAQMEAASDGSQPSVQAGANRASLPTTAQGSVDLDRLKLPDGVSISKINGPVPERKYFPCKAGPEAGGPQIVQSNPWSNPGAQQVPSAQFGNMYGAQPAKDPNVIVVDTNSLDADKGKSKKKKNKKSESNGLPPQPTLPSQPPIPSMAPTLPQPGAREWTPAQYGGYVPPADGKGGGQVLIKSVNGKVVITPVPGTGATTPPLPAQSSKKQPQPPAVKQSPAQSTVNPLPPTKKLNGVAPVPPSAGHEKSNGTPIVNGSNSNNNNLKGSEQIVNGTNGVNGDSVTKRTGKHKTPELEDLNSIFAPRSEDCAEMDAADREIEQFKLFCRDSVPVQNRTKVSFDVRNIAFKKKM